jgi:heme/copper-type cytochrome/quinol oxidase subunit 2
MKIKQKIVSLMITAGMIAGGAAILQPQLALADCGGAKTSIINCDQNSKNPASAQDTGVWGLLLVIINIMTAGVGILAVGGIVWAAILYSSSSDSADQTKKAKEIIRNVAIGIVAYAAMYLGLNFLIPGGIFS